MLSSVSSFCFPQQKPEQPCKSYTPLGALSSMQPPGSQGNHPDMSPRRHSAFSAPHQHGESRKRNTCLILLIFIFIKRARSRHAEYRTTTLLRKAVLMPLCCTLPYFVFQRTAQLKSRSNGQRSRRSVHVNSHCFPYILMRDARHSVCLQNNANEPQLTQPWNKRRRGAAGVMENRNLALN